MSVSSSVAARGARARQLALAAATQGVSIIKVTTVSNDYSLVRMRDLDQAGERGRPPSTRAAQAARARAVVALQTTFGDVDIVEEERAAN